MLGMAFALCSPSSIGANDADTLNPRPYQNVGLVARTHRQEMMDSYVPCLYKCQQKTARVCTVPAFVLWFVLWYVCAKWRCVLQKTAS